MKKREHTINESEKQKGKKMQAGLLLGIFVYTLTACSLPSDNQETDNAAAVQEESRADTGFIVPGPDSYDSADTAVLTDINQEENTLSFLNLTLNKQYTLSMDGTTRIYDKYGTAISLEQLKRGDVVEVTFLKSKKHLNSIMLSATAWRYDEMERYEINTVRREVTIGSQVYKLTDKTQYFSAGRRIEEIDLNSSDVLTFQGIDNDVLSINVDKGHGYLRLVNDENFVGGWIELGQFQIQRITEDMLLTVPEGSYQVNISHNGGGGTKDVVINRNEETTLDIGDLEVAEVKYGTVIFSMTPSTAKLYIDGSETDPSGPVRLEYGIHQIIAKADGYQSLTQYLKVAQESAGIDVVLDAVTEEESEEASETAGSASAESSSSADASGESSLAATGTAAESASVSSSSAEDTTTGYYKVYVDAPEGAEVYVDGNYVGIAPCYFKKASGSHVITLRKTGYETRSYTVLIDDEEKDISYSFAEMVKL